MCDWLVLIDTGRSLYQGPTRDAARRRRRRRLAVVAAARPTTSTRCVDAARRRRPPTSSVDDGRLVVDVDGADVGRRSPPRVNRAAFDAGIVLVELSPLRTTLEDRYLVAWCEGGSTDDPDHPRRAAPPRAPPHRSSSRPSARVAVRRRRHARPSSPSAEDDADRRSRRGGTTLAALAGHGGGTEAFAVGASFAGFLVFVTFIALIAAEFSGGTFRALLLRDPHRLRVIVGKLVGILIVAAGVVVAGRGCSRSCCRCSSPRRRTSRTGDWFSLGQPRRRAARLRHRVRRRRRLGRLRHDARRDLPLGAARARRRLRLGRPVREHRRRLLGHRLPRLPRPGAGVAHPGRHGRARASGPSSPPPSTPGSRRPPPPPSSPEGTSPS